MGKEKVEKRVLLKLSGEALLGPDKNAPVHPYDPDTLLDIAKQVAHVHNDGFQVAIVVGGGNIFRGAAGESRGMDRTLADYFGMLATIQNGIALLDLLERKCDVKTRLMTGLEVNKVAEPFIVRKAIRHLEKRRIIILAGGTGLPYFTTDTTAAQRACEIGASLLAKATDIDGVYDKDPKKYADANLLRHVSYDRCLKDDLKVLDPEAFSLCRDNEIPIRVFTVKKENSIITALTSFASEDIGSLITTKGGV